MTPPRTRKTASHATAILVGCLMALPSARFIQRHFDSGSSSHQEAVAFPAGDASNGEEPAHPAARLTTRAAAFQQAWRALALRPVPREERLLHQTALLERWAAFDLEGALRAARAEGGSISSGFDNAGDLAAAFRAAFTRHPEEAWRALARDPFGPGQEQLEDLWFDILLQHGHGKLPGVFQEMTSAQQGRAFRVTAIGGDAPQARAQLLDAFANGATGRMTESSLADLVLTAQPITPRETLDWTTLPAGAERIAARLDWSVHLTTLSAADFSAALAALPAADHPEVLRLVSGMINGSSPVLFPALDELVASGQWQTLGGNAIRTAVMPQSELYSESPSGVAATPSPRLIQWAQTLPDRPETAALLLNMMGDPSPAQPVGPPPPNAFPEGSWQNDEILLRQVSTALIYDREAIALSAADAIAGTARRDQAQELIRRAALLRSMR